MTRWSLIWAVGFSSFFIFEAFASPVTLLSSYHINDKKPLGSVSDRFLSYTLEPEVLTHVAACGEINASTNLFRGLMPAYLRIAGPDSDKLLFQMNADSKPASNITPNGAQNTFVTGSQWLKFFDFVNGTGLRLIVSLNRGLTDENSDIDLTNALEFISYSNKHNLDLDWELGYELQRSTNHNGRASGRDVSKLRKILEVFPRYRKSLIIGPDMTSLENRADVAFARNYLSEAGNSLDVFSLHYDFSNFKEDDDVYEKLSPVFSKMENYLWVKEGVLKAVSKGVVDKKSIWIGESENKDRSCSFSDTLSFIQRLGAVAELGASVYLRKPHLMSLYESTSEYWAAILFKSLVGKTVLDAKFTNGNYSKVFAFAHCTRVSSTPEYSIINPNVAYERGAVTMYGTNAGNEWSRLFFKLNSRYEQIVHLYVLTEDKSVPTKKTLLNKQELRLSSDNELPIVSPRIREYAKYVLLPPKSIFFLVLPHANSRICVNQNIDESHNAFKKYKSSGVSINNDTEIVGVTEFPGEEGEIEDRMIYVSYPKKQENSASSSPSPLSSSESKIPKNTKFITYSEDTWLSPLPTQLREIFYRKPARVGDDLSSSSSKKDKRVTKIDSYKIITQALLGKRNESENFSHETNPRFSRSVTVEADDSSTFQVDENEAGLMRTVDEEVEEEKSIDAREMDQDEKVEEERNHAWDEVEKEKSNDAYEEEESNDVSEPRLWQLRRRRNADVEANVTEDMTVFPIPVVDDLADDSSSNVTLVLDVVSGNETFSFDPETQEIAIIFETEGFVNETFPLDLNISDNYENATFSIDLKAPVSNKTFSFDSRASISDVIFDADDLENVRPSRGIARDVTSTETNISTRLHPARKPKKVKTTKAFAITDDTTLSTVMKGSTETLLQSFETTSSKIDQLSSFTPSVTESTSEESIKLETSTSAVIDDSSKTAAVETTILDVPSEARSVHEDHQPRDEVDQSAKHAKDDLQLTSVTSKPRGKPTLVPTSPVKHRPAGYLPYSTRKPTTKRGRVVKPTSHSSYTIRKKENRHSSNVDETRTTKTLSELIEIAHAKLDAIRETNKARIKALKDERMQEKSRRAGLPVRNKRNTEVVQIPHHVHGKVGGLEQNASINCHRPLGRSLSDDAFDKAREMCKDLSANAKGLYTDVSKNMRGKLSSITDWIENKYEEIKKELVSIRSEHDVTEIRKRMRNYNEEIRKELAEMRERLRSHRIDGLDFTTASPRQTPRESKRPVRVDLESSTPRARFRVHTTSAVPVDRNEADQNPKHPRTKHRMTSEEPIFNSRLVRSLISNDIYGDSADEMSTVEDQRPPIVDEFERDVIDAKSLEQNRHFMTVAIVTEAPKNRIANDISNNLIVDNDGKNSFKSPPEITNDTSVDEEMCDRSSNFFSYLWCKCKDFLVVMIKVFDIK